MIALLVLAAAAAVAAPPHAQPRTAKAVVAADEAWLKAEIGGDVEALNDLLVPDYVTVGPVGRMTGRDALIAAARRRGASAERAAAVAAWRATHPTRPVVRLFGDTAVLRWERAGAEEPAALSSVDVFVYAGGAWRAIYSQHSTVSS